MSLKINISHYKYLIELFICVLYFFFNTVFLPEGLTYMAILSPFFLMYALKRRQTTPLIIFTCVSVILFFIHYANGIHTGYYVRSWILSLTCLIFIIASYNFINTTTYIEKIFSRILYINTILVVIALIAFFIPPLFSTFWFVNAFTNGVSNFGRLKMFTYEASLYSITFAPLFIYYFFKVFQSSTKHKLFLLLLAAIPLLLSFSFGVLITLFLAFLIVALIESDKLPHHKKLFKYVLIISFFILLLFIVLMLLMPEHPIIIRIRNIFNNQDSSFKGRTTDSFILAYEIAKMKSLVFGVGPGQIKVYGIELYHRFYNIPMSTEHAIRIPNTVAETLAIYGIFGIIVRFGLLFYFYFKTKVFNNYFRQTLFIFIFIYQFTGSYIVSLNEIIIWLLAFSTTQFVNFDKKELYPVNKH